MKSSEAYLKGLREGIHIGYERAMKYIMHGFPKVNPFIKDTDLTNQDKNCIIEAGGLHDKI